MNAVTYVFCFLLTLLSPTANGAALNLASTRETVKSESIDYLFDPTGLLTFAEVANGSLARNFLKHTGQGDLGYARGAVWLRETIQAPKRSGGDWVVALDSPSFLFVDYFAVDAATGQVISARSGSGVRVEKRPFGSRFAAFPISLAAGSRSTLYLRIVANVAIKPTLTISSREKFFSTAELTNLFLHLYFGLATAMIVYNFFLFLLLRDLSYFYYVAFTLALATTFYVGTGMADFELGAFHAGWMVLHPSTLALAGVFLPLFVREFLNTKFHFRWLDRVILGIAAVNLLIFGATFVVFVAGIPELVSLLPLPLYFATGVAVLRKGFRPARFFLLSWAAGVLGTLIWAFARWGILPHNGFTFNGPIIGWATETLLFSMALADRVNTLTRQLLVKERREHDGELERAHAFYSEKLLSLGEMAAGIAHEINNPLAIISLRLDAFTMQLSRGETLLKDQLLAGFRDSQHAIRRIARIIQGLCYFARDAAGDPSVETPVDELLARTTELCAQGLIKQGIRLEVDNRVSGQYLSCRPAQMTQALMSLVSNAQDALAECRDKRIRITADQKQDQLVFSVEDNGTGIPLEIRHKVMLPFFTTKQVGKGTGLGLCISKGIAESHFGTLEITESSRAGTTLALRLPMKKSPDSPRFSQAANPW